MSGSAFLFFFFLPQGSWRTAEQVILTQEELKAEIRNSLLEKCAAD